MTIRLTYAMSLSTYTVANAILLVVETGLFMPGDMTVVTGGHRPFFVTDGVILCMETGSLCSADLTFATLLVDAAVLVVQPAIDLCTTGVLTVPTAILSEGGGTNTQQSDEGGGEKE